MRRSLSRAVLAAFCLSLAAPAIHAQALEKPKLVIGVGGKSLFYYLPLTIAEQKGYFKDEGLEVEIPDFPGGAKALQAMIGGSADMVSARTSTRSRSRRKDRTSKRWCCRARTRALCWACPRHAPPRTSRRRI